MAVAESEPSCGHAELLHAVEKALHSGDMAGAMRLSEDAVTAGAEHPTLLSLAGLRRMGRADNAAALPLLLRARTLAPRHVGTLDALGQCLTRLGRPREALAVFDAALSVAPDARLYFNKAMALEDASALDEARAALTRAIALAPAHAEALARLALLAAQRGDAGAARSFAERALKAKPGEPVARIALAMAALEEKDFAAGEAQISVLLRMPDLTPVNLAIVHGLAGDILDAQDKPAEAFTAYSAAKSTLRAAYAGTMTGESVRAREQSLADYFRKAEPMAWRGAAAQSPRTHVFLIGFPRSGTTLLEQVLAAHPDVEAMEERACLVDSATEFFGSNQDLDRLAALGDGALAPWRQAYWNRVAETGPLPSKRVFIDKMPLNLVFLPLVAKLFPAAKILLALRDPRDVVLSCFRRRFAMNAGMYEFTSLDTAAAYYAAVMELTQVYSGMLALALCPTRHESLIADFAGEARRLCDFLGLEFHDEMGGFAWRARARNIDTPSGTQVARGLTAAGLGQWRRYREQLAPILPVLAPFVARFGYPET
jgi:tetratricopeptide (TPR) repeat protein